MRARALLLFLRCGGDGVGEWKTRYARSTMMTTTRTNTHTHILYMYDADNNNAMAAAAATSGRGRQRRRRGFASEFRRKTRPILITPHPARRDGLTKRGVWRQRTEAEEKSDGEIYCALHVCVCAHKNRHLEEEREEQLFDL